MNVRTKVIERKSNSLMFNMYRLISVKEDFIVFDWIGDRKLDLVVRMTYRIIHTTLYHNLL